MIETLTVAGYGLLFALSVWSIWRDQWELRLGHACFAFLSLFAIHRALVDGGLVPTEHAALPYFLAVSLWARWRVWLEHRKGVRP